MFRWIFGDAGSKLKSATAGMEKYVAKFEAAAVAAEKEAEAIAAGLVKKLTKFDSKVAAADVKLDKAYSKHAATQGKYTAKATEAVEAADARKETLDKIAATARKAVENHKAIYLS